MKQYWNIVCVELLYIYKIETWFMFLCLKYVSLKSCFHSTIFICWPESWDEMLFFSSSLSLVSSCDVILNSLRLPFSHHFLSLHPSVSFSPDPSSTPTSHLRLVTHRFRVSIHPSAHLSSLTFLSPSPPHTFIISSYVRLLDQSSRLPPLSHTRPSVSPPPFPRCRLVCPVRLGPRHKEQRERGRLPVGLKGAREWNSMISLFRRVT